MVAEQGVAYQRTGEETQRQLPIRVTMKTEMGSVVVTVAVVTITMVVAISGGVSGERTNR